MGRFKRLGFVFLVVVILALGCGSEVGETLLGRVWNGSQWIVISIDAATGAVVNQIGTLPAGNPESMVQGSFVVDSAGEKAYLHGGTAGSYGIYTIDLNTGLSSNVTLQGYPQDAQGTLEFDFYKSDELLGCVKNGDMWDIVSINATTGAVMSVITTLPSGDPEGIVQGSLVVDPANERAYLYGRAVSAYRIYTIDLHDGSHSSVALQGSSMNLQDGTLEFDLYHR